MDREEEQRIFERIEELTQKLNQGSTLDKLRASVELNEQVKKLTEEEGQVKWLTEEQGKDKHLLEGWASG